MAYTVLQTRRFARQYKKLTSNITIDVDREVDLIARQPDLGEPKKGDLARLRVHKFRSQNQLYLLGYTVDDDVRLIYLEALGAHENFYRDIKR